MRAHQKMLQSVLIKPAGPDCNLACGYCFYRDRAALFPPGAHRMSDAVLAETVRQVLRDGVDEVVFGWQGGEPTLLGPPFFERAVELQKRHGRDGQTVGNGLQTNGLCIDDAWIRLLRAYRFLVGLSLDGPRHVHDHHRRAHGGQPTWSRVVDAAKRLLDGGVAVNALAVVTSDAAAHAREIYAFLRDVGLRHMQFIPCVECETGAPGRAAAFSITGGQLGRFLCEVFDAWRADFREGRPTTSVRWFDAILAAYVGMRPAECALLPECGNYLVVEHNGDVFPCDFYVEGATRLGNVRTERLVELLNSRSQARFGRRKAELPAECQVCPWLRYCRGGCPRERWDASNAAGRAASAPVPSQLCAGYRMFFEHADAALRELAAAWRATPAASAGAGSGGRFAPAGRNTPCPCGSGRKHKHCCGR